MVIGDVRKKKTYGDRQCENKKIRLYAVHKTNVVTSSVRTQNVGDMQCLTEADGDR